MCIHYDGLLYQPVSPNVTNVSARTHCLKFVFSNLFFFFFSQELLRECQLQIEEKIGGLQKAAPAAPAMHQAQPQLSCAASLNASDNGHASKMSSGSSIVHDCPKENYGANQLSLINSADNCGLHPRIFKHTPCVVSDASIGVEF